MYDQNNRKCRCGKQGRRSKINHFGEKKMPEAREKDLEVKRFFFTRIYAETS